MSALGSATFMNDQIAGLALEDLRDPVQDIQIDPPGLTTLKVADSALTGIRQFGQFGLSQPGVLTQLREVQNSRRHTPLIYAYVYIDSIRFSVYFLGVRNINLTLKR